MRKKLLWMLLTIPLILGLLSVNTIEVNAQETHDIAVIGVTPSPTLVRLGELVNVTVVVKNKGTVDETFNVTVYYDTTAIETKTVLNLALNTTRSFTLSWNTTERITR
jgi:subtilase family serine protease